MKERIKLTYISKLVPAKELTKEKNEGEEKRPT
jgi:hypothetical protein